MKNIFTILFMLSAPYAIYSQTCNGRYQTQIYSNVNVTTVNFGEAVNMAGDTQILKMDIYQAQGDTATNRPVVIFCFGGSFVGGDRTSSELVSFATSLAKRGYVAASIDYRLAENAFDLVNKEKLIKVVFGAVQDGKAAIRYFRKNFDEGNSLGIDPKQIFIGGTSAGGILAINLAYVDTLSKLPCEWQNWAVEIGGIEGNSGNPGYCSYVNGVFGFAGAVADTAFINANDVPFYGIHAEDDETVKYNYGPPLENPFVTVPVNLYGSNPIDIRLNNLGIYSSFDSYTGGDHPPFNGNNNASNMSIMNTTTNNLSSFLYNILDCNSNNLKKADQQDCNSFYASDSTYCAPVSIRNIHKNYIWTLYPNPAENTVNIGGVESFDKIKIYDTYGKLITSENLFNQTVLQIDVRNFAKGMYYVQLIDGISTESTILIIE